MSRQGKRKEWKLSWVEKRGLGARTDVLVSDSSLPLMVQATITLSMFSHLCNEDIIGQVLL